MAGWIEKFESRVGSSRGLSGQKLNRSGHVILDHADDDPLEILALIIPMGSASPFNHNTIDTGSGTNTQATHWPNVSVLTDTSIRERLGPLRYAVDLVYTPFSTVTMQTDPALKGWELSVRSASDSVEVGVQTDGKTPLGQRLYNKVTEADADSYAIVKGEKVWLKVDPTERKMEKRQMDVNGAALILRREVPALNISVAGVLVSYRGQANIREFLGSQPGHLRFVDLDISPSPSGERTRTVDSGNTLGIRSKTLTGLGYTVQLSFLWSAVRMQPETIYPTWTDEETGDRVPIRAKEGYEITWINAPSGTRRPSSSGILRVERDEIAADIIDIHKLLDMQSMLATVMT